MKKRISSLFLAAAFTAAIVLTVSGFAAAEPPVKVVVGNYEVLFNGDFTPKAISKTKPTPIAFNVSGQMRTLNGEHVPPLKEFVIEGDKHASISVAGIAKCTPAKITARTTAQARKICGPALIGSGKTEVGVKFAEQEHEIPVHSELLAFNGGVKGGVTTLLIHAYITVPTPAAIVTTVKVTKIHKGRYGLLSVASIPKIAGGAGSVKSFSLTLNKGIISATCPDGHLNARGFAVFGDAEHTKIEGSVVRSCTGKG